MNRNIRSLALIAIAGAAVVIAAACRGPAGPAGPAGSPGPTGSPGTGLPPGEGFILTLTTAQVTADAKVQIDFMLTDSAGNGWPLDGVTINWTLAVLSSNGDGTTEWTNYYTKHVTGAFGSTDQPTYDRTGAYTDFGGGRYRYEYTNPLPSGDDPATLHRAGAWATHVLDDGSNQGSTNSVLDFVPDGEPPYPAREWVATEACNGCHNPLEAHGGYRREVKLCATCHTKDLFDPDSADSSTVTLATPAMNPLRFDSLVHRIHRGKALPSLVAASVAGVVGQESHVVGYQNSDIVFGETVADGPDSNTLPDLKGIGFPQALSNCATCHQGGAQSASWPEAPVTRRACTSCHDTTWFGDPLATPPRMENHAAGPYADDTMCAGVCHVAESGEFDLSVRGSHVFPKHSTQLRGLDATIVAVSGTAGGNPTFSFTVTNHDDASVVTSSGLASISVNVSGPTSDYLAQNVISLSLKPFMVTAPPDGIYTATFPNRGATDAYFPSGPVIPAGSTGTFALGLQATRTVVISGKSITEAAMNPVKYFSVDGSDVKPRRKVVDLDNCNQCHDLLALHGGGRVNTEYCVLCHNPTNSDWNRRPKVSLNTNIPLVADHLEERSVDFKQLIHRIHTGEHLEASQPFYIYGFGGSLNDFGDVLFPGDRAVCTTCHLPKTYTVDAVPEDAVWPVVNETGTIMHSGTAKHGAGETAIGPIQAACLGCHDSVPARAHANLMTPDGVETCIVCHAEDDDFSVTKVHAGK